MSGMVEKCRGKTKIIWVSGETSADLEALDVVTWNNDRQEPMDDKGVYSTTTTASVFQLLQEAGLPVAFTKQVGSRTFRAPMCDMIPLEVIVRAVAEEHSSYLKRNPDVEPGIRFPDPVVEFFLKIDEAAFSGIPLPDVDPYIGSCTDAGITVYHPKKPLADGVEIGAALLGWDGPHGQWPFDEIERIARAAFDVTQRGWARLNFDLLDWKIEFGYGPDGALLIADVIDNDSWRIRGPDGKEYSKQNVRNGMSIDEAANNYKYIARQSVLMLARARRPSDS